MDAAYWVGLTLMGAPVAVVLGMVVVLWFGHPREREGGGC